MKYSILCLLVGLIAFPLGAAEPASLPAAATSTASHAVIQAGRHLGEKAVVHRFERLRAGAIKTEKGWNVQDFASSFFNPTLEEITVSMKMVSDNPNFRFANGQTGTYTKTYKLRPMQGCTDNIYIGSTAFGKTRLAGSPWDELHGVGGILRFQAFLLLHAEGDGHRRKT